MVLYVKLFNNRGMRGYSKDNPFQKERSELGDTIKRIRKQKGLTQEKLAERVDADVSYLAKIENGYVNTSIRYLIKISRGLGVKVKDLFGF